MMAEIRGLTNLALKLGRLAAAVSGAPATRAIMQGALVFERGAKRRAPVDTGKLRASIKAQPAAGQPGVAIIGTNVEYAPYQEYGTVHQRGTPFMRPTIDLDKRQIARAVLMVLQEEIKRAAR